MSDQDDGGERVRGARGRSAAEYGVDVGSVRVDMKRVMARREAVSKESRTGLEDWLRSMENCTVYQGHARFESAQEVSVGGERLRADKIFSTSAAERSFPTCPAFTSSTSSPIAR